MSNSLTTPCQTSKLVYQTPNPPFDVLVHTEALLVIQTHAGQPLATGKHSESGDLNNLGDMNTFGDFNLGLHVNDDANQVLANRGRLLAAINACLKGTPQASTQRDDKDVASIYWLNQIHSNQVLVIDGDSINDNSLSIAEQSHSKPKSSTLTKNQTGLTPPSADALVTKKSHVGLAIMTADCVPIALYDKHSTQIAAIHAGWQGLANGVIAKTVAVLKQQAGNEDLQDCQAWIGACISQSCYEVSQEVVDKLLCGCQKMGMDIEAVRDVVVGKHDNPDKAWLDLPTLAVFQLQQQGVMVNSYSHKDTKFEIPPIEVQTHTQWAYGCSYSNPNYYSYRRMTHLKQKNTGRMTLIAVRLN